MTNHSRNRADRRAEKAVLERRIKESRRAALIVNTRSRHGASAYSEAKQRLTDAGMTLDAAYPVRHAERLPAIVREEVAKGRKFIIIGGGDGTISSVVDHFAYANVVFGVLLLGTANDFARTCGIPLDLDHAVHVLVNGKVADVDLGRIGDDYFANGASIGMPSIVGRATPPVLKRWLGRVAYALVGMNKFFRYRPYRCIVTVDGEEIVLNALDIRIASGGYHGGALLVCEADPDDGNIVVQILKGSSKWALAQAWTRMAMGAPLPPCDVEIIRAPELIIDTDPRQHVSIDGEVITETPIRVSVAREALLLMVPSSYDDSDIDRAPRERVRYSLAVSRQLGSQEPD